MRSEQRSLCDGSIRIRQYGKIARADGVEPETIGHLVVDETRALEVRWIEHHGFDGGVKRQWVSFGFRMSAGGDQAVSAARSRSTLRISGW